MKIEFFIAIVPPTKTAQQRRVRMVGGKPVFYDDAELAAVKEKLLAHLCRHKPSRRLEGPIRLVTKWCWPLGNTGTRHNGQWKTTKPDTDNVLKAFKDAMTRARFWTDDCQVVSEITEKFWADQPGIWVSVEELEARDE